MRSRIEAGLPYPLGATPDGDGTNFALFSSEADRVELCLYDPGGRHETARIDIVEKTQDVWHAYLPGVEPGTAYGYRVHGPFEPQAGYRFNPHKLLLDPYAKQLVGEFRWHESHYAYDRSGGALDLDLDRNDNADYMYKAAVCASKAIGIAPRRPLTPWHATIIYEVHLRGYTMSHPDVPERLRGTIDGLTQPQVLDYIRALGVTSVELLPVYAFVDEHFLVEKGLRNYWGYNPLNFFTPHPAYAADAGAFRDGVARLHDAGLEVILDVVYNHTAEGNHLGPTLSLRGIDNRAYYRLLPSDPRFYINDSGCGNTLDIAHPRVMQLVLDSLRYWAGEIGVDGFRFDLATALGRDERGFDANSTLFQALAQDPLLAGCKLIAEPWDLGPDGYQLGRFPAGFSEWNDRYRDTVRRFWRGDPGQLPELARRLHGSGDIFEHRGRKPSAGINFVTSHDGFTLRDLVSYNRRDNRANLEDNNDGHRENLSYNHGVEGPSDDPAVDAVRRRQQRNLLATLLLSQGVPMLLAGDEMGRSQQGNNNAYCQDNAISWIDWNAADRELIDFTRRLLALRREWPVLQANEFRHYGKNTDEDSIRWFNADGKSMRDAHWHERENRMLGYLLSESKPDSTGLLRQLLVVFNASAEAQQFSLPVSVCGPWRLLIDTAEVEAANVQIATDTPRRLEARSLQILAASAGTAS